MYQKDFILRMIEDFFRFMSIILKLKVEKDYEQAFVVISETSQKLLKIDIKALSENDEDFEKNIKEDLQNGHLNFILNRKK